MRVYFLTTLIKHYPQKIFLNHCATLYFNQYINHSIIKLVFLKNYIIILLVLLIHRFFFLSTPVTNFSRQIVCLEALEAMKKKMTKCRLLCYFHVFHRCAKRLEARSILREHCSRSGHSSHLAGDGITAAEWKKNFEVKFWFMVMLKQCH